MLYKSKYTLVIFLYVLCLNYITSGAAYPWQAHHEGYDASLDPVIWSRAFVKDNIRRSRQFPALPPSAIENNEILLNDRCHEYVQRFINSNHDASDILRDEKRRAENSFGRRRSGVLQLESDWNTAASYERRSSSKRESNSNRSKLQHRRKRNHIR